MNTVNITFFILLLLLVQPMIRKHFSAVCLYRVWVILLIGLLIPIRFELINPLIHLGIPRMTVDDKAAYELDTHVSYEVNKDADKYSLPASQFVLSDSNNISQARASNSLGQYLFGIINSFIHNGLLYLLWIIGAVLLLTMNIVSYYRYKRQIKGFLQPAKEEILEEISICINDVKQKNSRWNNRSRIFLRKTAVFECSIIESPITIGILNPMIILPKESYTKKDLNFLLQHELVHILQKDSLIKLIRLIVLSLNWFNPICYVLSRNLDNWCEAACDEIVLHKAVKSDCLYYCKLILKCASTQIKQTPSLLINFYGGKNNMKLRFKSILIQNKKRSGKFLLVLIIGIVSTTVIVTAGNQKAKATSESDFLEGTIKDTLSEGDAITGSQEIVEDINTEASEGTKTQDVSDAVSIDVDTVDVGELDVDIADAADSDSLRASIVEFAKQAEGTPYLWGGTDLSTGVDSSGFVQAIYKNFGYDIPRISRDQLNESKAIHLDELLPGDLVFYKGAEDNNVNHVGMYIGDNQVIHAANAKVGVVICDMNYRTPHSGGRYLPD